MPGAASPEAPITHAAVLLDPSGPTFRHQLVCAKIKHRLLFCSLFFLLFPLFCFCFS